MSAPRLSPRQVFLDLAERLDLAVVAAFEMGGATQTPLATYTDMQLVRARLRRQIRASKHRAIVLWLIGNELNGAWHLYVCDDEYAMGVLYPAYGITRCQFGTDAAALLRAVDALCEIAHEEGLPCR